MAQAANPNNNTRDSDEDQLSVIRLINEVIDKLTALDIELTAIHKEVTEHLACLECVQMKLDKAVKRVDELEKIRLSTAAKETAV